MLYSYPFLVEIHNYSTDSSLSLHVFLPVMGHLLRTWVAVEIRERTKCHEHHVEGHLSGFSIDGFAHSRVGACGLEILARKKNRHKRKRQKQIEELGGQPSE